MYTLALLLAMPFDHAFTDDTNKAWHYATCVWMDERNSIADRAAAIHHVEEKIMGNDRNTMSDDELVADAVKDTLEGTGEETVAEWMKEWAA